MPYWPPVERMVWMVVIRMITIITMSTVDVRWPAIGNAVMPYYGVAVIMYINMLTVINVDVDVLFTVVNVNLISNICFVANRLLILNIRGFVAPCIWLNVGPAFVGRWTLDLAIG